METVNGHVMDLEKLEHEPRSTSRKFYKGRFDAKSWLSTLPSWSLARMSLLIFALVILSYVAVNDLKFNELGALTLGMIKPRNNCNSEAKDLPEAPVTGPETVAVVVPPISSEPPEPDPCAADDPEVKALPCAMKQPTSNLETMHLWNDTENKRHPKEYLLAMPVGIKQKEAVDTVVQKFLADNFVVMLFHYDGIVDEWMKLPWGEKVIHVIAMKQTKWWFAKRFMHPNIVGNYKYIFLWDEDLGVENFNVSRYIQIVDEEGLEISQPALDPRSGSIHHEITRLVPDSKLHRRSWSERLHCTVNDTEGPPCSGFVELMAPTFSSAAWKCIWNLIQNDLIYGWGIDFSFGYCAQGDRTLKVGVVDEQYIIHKGIPSLNDEVQSPGSPVDGNSEKQDIRGLIVRRSFNELATFRRRWKQAAEADKYWQDPYKKPAE